MMNAKDCYPEIYMMKPAYEIYPGWWKLQWKPIWRKTVSAYWLKRYPTHRDSGWYLLFNRGLGVRWSESGAHNGWGRSYNCVAVEFDLLFGSLEFWIKWNYVVMAKGPMDGGDPVPLFPSEPACG